METGGVSDVAYLKEPQLSALGKQCAVANNASVDDSDLTFAAISKVTGTYDTTNTTADGVFLKQFDGFYITIGFPNGGACTDKNDDLNNQVRTRSNEDQASFVNAFKTSAMAIR